MTEEERQREAKRIEREENGLSALFLDPESVRLARESESLMHGVRSDSSDDSSENDTLTNESSYIEENPFVRFAQFLEYLDKDNAHQLSSKIYRLNEQLRSIPIEQLDTNDVIMTSPSKVVEQFMDELVARGDCLFEEKYRLKWNEFFSHLLDETVEEDRTLQLFEMAICLNDSSISVKELLDKYASSSNSESVDLSQVSAGSTSTNDDSEDSTVSSSVSSLDSEADEEDTFINFSRFLDYAYEDKAHMVSYQVYNLNLQLDKISVKKKDSDEMITMSPLEVVEHFLVEISIDDPLYGEVYGPVAKLLLKGVLNQDAGKEAQMLQLNLMASSLGDCPTPVNDLCMQVYIGECVKEKGALTDFQYGIIEREGLQKHIVKELDHLLKKNDKNEKIDDKIELVNGLLEAVYGNGFQKKRNNPIRINGERTFLPSKSRNINFAYEQLKRNKKLIHAFAKIVCITKSNGEPLVSSDGRFMIDRDKIIVISEKYFTSLGDISPRGKYISLYKARMEEFIALPEHRHLSLEHSSKMEVNRLLNVPERQNKFRSLLFATEIPQIEKVYNDFLEKDKQDISELSKKLRTVSTNNDFDKAMTKPGNSNKGGMSIPKPQTKTRSNRSRKPI